MTTYLFAQERHAKQNYALKSLLHQGPNEFLQPLHTPPTLTRERQDLDACFRVVGDEDGVHEHRLGKCALRLPGARERVLVATLQHGAIHMVMGSTSWM